MPCTCRTLSRPSTLAPRRTQRNCFQPLGTSAFPCIQAVVPFLISKLGHLYASAGDLIEALYCVDCRTWGQLPGNLFSGLRLQILQPPPFGEHHRQHLRSLKAFVPNCCKSPGEEREGFLKKWLKQGSALLGLVEGVKGNEAPIAAAGKGPSPSAVVWEELVPR